MTKRLSLAFIATILVLAGCRNNQTCTSPTLEQQLYNIVNQAPGTVGVAFVSDNDTVLINNGVHYAMMSVFKLHEALAVCNALERQGSTSDSIISIASSELDRNTWSPMLKEYGDTDFNISIKDLINYAIVSSDNNASNLLFKKIISPTDAGRFIKSIAADTTFAIAYSEADMKQNHELSYCNYSSPLSASLLIKQVFTSDIVSEPHQEAIKHALATVTTGHDRLGAAIVGNGEVLFAHKTGSGYRNNRGELVAFNDVAYFRLPDGRDYSLAVMIRDFSGSEAEAAAIMSEISKTVYSFVSGQSNRDNNIE